MEMKGHITCLFICGVLTLCYVLLTQVENQTMLPQNTMAAERIIQKVLNDDPVGKLNNLTPDKFVAYEVNSTGVERRFPQAIIIGEMKCGTGSLRLFLGIHPLIRKSKTEEIHFFDRDEVYNLGVDWYRKQMPLTKTGEITLENTPRYFRTTHVPERMHKFNSSIKLLLMVRDPTKRVISEYAHHKAHKRAEAHHTFTEMVFNSNGTINETYPAILKGKYHLHYKRWLRYFPQEQILILDGEEMVKDPLPLLQRVEQFLGLTPYIERKHVVWNETKHFYCPKLKNKVLCLSERKGRQHPNVSDSNLKTLRNYYIPHNKIFEQMLNRTFSWS